MSRSVLDEFIDLVHLAESVRKREISPVEVVTTSLERISGLNGELNLYITVLDQQAVTAAESAEREIANGAYRGPLHGIPLSLKDLYETQGIRTTAGSRVNRDHVPTENAAVVAHLLAGGAIIIGKANMKEFACAPPHPDYGATVNPWSPTRTASGSSGGSAAAVVVGTDFGSMGSDTGGSIRVPASFCGAVGFKPSFGLISRSGMEFVSPTLDHAGPLARSVRDVAALLDATVGLDPRDHASISPPAGSYSGMLMNQAADGGKGLIVGVVTNMIDDADDAVRQAVGSAIVVIEETGASVREVTIEGLRDHVLATHGAIVWAEASYRHRRRLNQDPERFSPTLRGRLERGLQIAAVDYLAALAHRDRLRREMETIGNSFDLLILPTVPCPATPLEPASLEMPGIEADVSFLMTRTAPFNLTGQPAITLPCGFTSAGMPLGLEIVGPYKHDHKVLQLGHAYQSRTDWHLRRPSVVLN